MTNWKIFGKTLAVSHLSMLPFLWLIVYAFVYITQKICFSKSGRIIGLGLLLLHPYILTQATLMSYDIIQIGFFLICLMGIIEKRSIWLIIGIWGLSLCSVRGQLIGVICLGCYLLMDYKNRKHHILISVIACAPFLLWHYYHYLQTGWMISTPSGSWETHRNVAGIQQMASTAKGIIRGFTDYGTIALSLFFIHTLWFFRKQKISFRAKKILFTTIVLFLGLNASMLLFSNPIGHRYFMVIHVGMILFIISQWQNLFSQKIWSGITFITFITGHFWLYPTGISNGWDVTLKYISYEKNRKDFFNYLSQENITTKEIVSAFPLFCSQQQTDLQSGERLSDISEVSNFDFNYIAFSQVCNDMKTIPVSHHKKIKTFGKGKTAILLYKIENK